MNPAMNASTHSTMSLKIMKSMNTEPVMLFSMTFNGAGSNAPI